MVLPLPKPATKYVGYDAVNDAVKPTMDNSDVESSR